MTISLPTDISGCVAWFRADTIASLTEGQAITTWNDESGQGNHITQATASRRPIYGADRWNGLPGVVFTGESILGNAAPSGRPTSGVTAFVVMSLQKGDSTSQENYFPQAVAWGSGSTNGFALYWAVDVPSTSALYRPGFIVKTDTAWADNFAVDTASAHNAVRGNPYITSGRRNGATTQVRFDLAAGNTDSSGGTGNIDYGASNELTVGGKALSGPLGLLRGTVHEVIVYNSALSDAQVADVEAYLNNKWKVTRDQATHYAWYNGGFDSYWIGHAWSPDGKHFKKHSTYVLDKGSSGAFDDGHVKEPCVVWDGSQWVMYYAGYDGTKYAGIGRATSPDGLTWTKTGQVLATGGSGAWDESYVAFATVLKVGSTWHMWYSGKGTTVTVERLGYATSSDGITWTKHPSNPVLDVGATYDQYGVLAGAVAKVGGTFHLYYAGRRTNTGAVSKWNISHATSSDGVTWTKDAANPLADNGVTTGEPSSKALTADLAGRTVTLNNTTHLVAGDWVMFIDGTSNTPELNRIASVDSGTQITLAWQSVDAFTTATGAAMRRVDFGSISPRSILYDGSEFVVYGTPFQPVSDANADAGELREMSARWTGPSLSGALAYDSGTGLLFPVEGLTEWDIGSAENPSVLRVDGTTGLETLTPSFVGWGVPV